MIYLLDYYLAVCLKLNQRGPQGPAPEIVNPKLFNPHEESRRLKSSLNKQKITQKKGLPNRDLYLVWAFVVKKLNPCRKQNKYLAALNSF